MRALTPTLAICALAAAFTAGALTADPARPASGGSTDHAAEHQSGTAPAATAPTAADSATPAPDVITITIRDFGFEVPAVTAGATVRVVNADGVPHTVTANDGAFDVFVDPGAETTFVVPATPGTYAFFCSVHPSMTSSLVVT